MTTISASAPGKLFITGEYAVLDHAPALVTAVDVRANCRLRFAEDDACRIHTPPLAAAPAAFRIEDGDLQWQHEPVGLLDAAWHALDVKRREKLGERRFHITLDSAAFFLKERKLGLGSSAAALAALMGTLWAASGGLPAADDAFVALKSAHDRWQGGGSGADLAVALAGGTILYRREPRVAAPVALPAGLEILPVWSGEAASTGDFLRRIAAFEQREPDAFRHCFAVLAKTAEEAALAASGSDADAFLEAFSGAGVSLRALGKAADLPIWSAAHERIGEVVRAAGGSYKPSGAGGGDVGLALVPTGGAAAAERVKSALSSAAYRVLPLRFGARGLTVNEG